MPNLTDWCRMVGPTASVRQAANDAGVTAPLSLRALMGSSGCPFTKCVRLHLKTLVTPTVSVGNMLLRMREVYQTADIGVRVGSRESLTGIANFATLSNPSVVKNCPAGQTTTDQQNLFQNRNNVGTNDIVIYFVQTTNPALNGCASFPSGEPGAIVTQSASSWTLGHETGHVLGLAHIAGENTNCTAANPTCCDTPDFTRLMTGCGTSNITTVPTVSQTEIDTMRASTLAPNC